MILANEDPSTVKKNWNQLCCQARCVESESTRKGIEEIFERFLAGAAHYQPLYASIFSMDERSRFSFAIERARTGGC